jgi:hypothetical protein
MLLCLDLLDGLALLVATNWIAFIRATLADGFIRSSELRFAIELMVSFIIGLET